MFEGDNSRKETSMKFKVINGIFALALIVGVVGVVALALSLSVGAASLSAPSAPNARNGQLHVTKNCTGYQGNAGESCTITSSTLAAIPANSIVVYDQADGIPAGMLDSNVILDAGNGNRAIGRCTVDDTTGLGLCTFSDGLGEFAGFQARIEVSYISGDDFAWDGTYSFSPVTPRP
jgi:hypothetical protein